MPMEYFRIGEFAKVLGVSTEYLKFYERKGLVCPFEREDNGYRYYISPQLVHIIEYGKLQQMGFSLKEAQQMIQQDTLEEYLTHLDEQNQVLEQEIQRLTTAQARLKFLQDALKLTEQSESWEIVELSPIQYETLPLHASPSYLAPDWRNSCFMEFWTCTTPEQKDRTWGVIRWENTLDSPQPRQSTIPCFLHYQSLPAHYDESNSFLLDSTWNIAPTLKLVEEQGLQVRDKIYQQRLCLTHDPDQDHVRVITLVPLK